MYENRRHSTWLSKVFTNGQLRISFAVILLLYGAYLFGVVTRTFRFHTTTIGAGTEYEAEAWALVPVERQGPVPVVIFLHGFGESLQRTGASLRKIVDEGYAAVGIEYDQKNRKNFRSHLNELSDWIEGQEWAQQDATVWMGFGLGAQRFLRYFVDNDRTPAIMIRVGGGTIPELKDGFPRPISLPIWLIHGENDRVFPLNDVEYLRQQMMEAGARVRLDILPGRPHSLKNEEGVVIKLLMDRLKTHWNQGTQ